jgi:hypothetical protein
MTGKTTLNAKNLESLGPERLAALLIEITTGDAAARRHLRMALAGAQSPTDLAKEVRKRLAAIAKSRSFVDRVATRSLANDLDSQRRAIVETVAQLDPGEALDLIWRFMALATPVFDRCDDSDGEVSGVFGMACRDIGLLAEKARPDAERLADQVFAALMDNGFGQFNGLIPVVAPALGARGIGHLKSRIVDLANTPVQRPAAKDRVSIGWAASGPIYADDLAERSRLSTIRGALQEIADVQGDADAYIATFDEAARRVPNLAAGIAHRLLRAGRATEALAALDAVEPRNPSRRIRREFEWEDARIAVLEALGRAGEAQQVRWACFERELSSKHLREYLKKLPDFADVEAEEKAFDLAERHPVALAALRFLVEWPALHRAARLVLTRKAEMDGDHYEILSPAADALAAKHPLAATVVLRAMIDFTLNKARATRYKHAARHLQECARLASSITDFAAFETHAAYAARLHREHGAKAAFWSLMR